jgi:hypothetical protein
LWPCGFRILLAIKTIFSRLSSIIKIFDIRGASFPGCYLFQIIIS